jgi:hypothetical protein
MKFRKKPVVVDAIQWTGDNLHDVEKFCPVIGRIENEYALHIETLEGVMTARCGDWIVKGTRGEFYPVKPDIFEATYEKVG